jgi:hypothetical protein
MITQEIPRKEWPQFLDQFSRDHQAWLVTLEAQAGALGNQLLAGSRPLLGVSAEGDSVSIMVGARPENHLDHRVTEAEHIWLEQNDEHNDLALQIESRDGVKTLLRFRSTMSAALLDHMVE